MARAHPRLYPNRGSHLPVLITLVQETEGPVLELGMGLYSSTYLHWACRGTKRRLVSYENNPLYYDFAKKYRNDYHEVHCISNWEALDLSEPWTIAFVDHEPGLRRAEEIKRLTHAEYIVAHDTENKSDRKYGYSKILHLFKYRWKYTDAVPHTSIFSNKHDIRDFQIK